MDLEVQLLKDSGLDTVRLITIIITIVLWQVKQKMWRGFRSDLWKSPKNIMKNVRSCWNWWEYPGYRWALPQNGVMSCTSQRSLPPPYCRTGVKGPCPLSSAELGGSFALEGKSTAWGCHIFGLDRQDSQQSELSGSFPQSGVRLDAWPVRVGLDLTFALARWG